MMENIKRKIIEKDGAAIILITMFALIVSITLILPSIVDNGMAHLVSKKIKNHINTISKSGSIESVYWPDDGTRYVLDYGSGLTAMINTTNRIFNDDGSNNFLKDGSTRMTSVSSSDVYQSADNTIALQLIVYQNVATGLRPSVEGVNEISSKIFTNSEGQIVNGWKDVVKAGQININHTTSYVIMRYDYRSPKTGEIVSIIRVASSENQNL